jgi:hypothetical protein
MLPKNFFFGLSLIQKLPKADRDIVEDVFSRNAYMAHPENVLLTMLCDSNKSLRDRAVKTILQIRENPTKFKDDFKYEETSGMSDESDCPSESESETEFLSEEEDPDDAKDDFPYPTPKPIRPFKVPKLNFQAKSYPDMIFWDEQLFEPPLTKKLSDAELKECVETPFTVPDYPCHTQMVERGVKMVTKASTMVFGEKERDGYIRQKIHSRTIIPSFRSKQDILPLLSDD